MTTIQILMGVHRGEAFLPTQLQSLKDQTDDNWCLLASDDSPDTASRAILDGFANDIPQKVKIISGPRSGFANNYMHLMQQAEPGFTAMADQDDLWLPEKLTRARTALNSLPKDRPALYCARIQPWDGVREVGPPFPPLRRATGFANALIENVATGNTILLNPAATALARDMAARTGEVFAHDWWLYLLISGVGGHVIHDDGPPVVLYRQHDDNMVGAGRGFQAQFRRKRAVLKGAFAQRLGLNIAALDAARDRLTPENARLLDGFKAARSRHGLARAWAMKQLRVYRQRPLGTIGFLGAAALGRV
ncbi:MAG: glycosyltransferase [Pseudomonadota bacterium]